MKKIFVFSLGCPRNLVDSQVLSGSLLEAGFALTDNAEEADIAVVNTCGFIEEAKNESIDHILSLARMKSDGDLEKLLIMGCLSQRYPSELCAEIKEIDAVFGSSDFMEIPKMISAALSGGGTSAIQKVSSVPSYLYDHNSSRVISSPSHSVYVKVQEGCSNGCSYCVIPRLKGRRRSRDVFSVVEEVMALRKEHKVKEIVLIGQDTTSYGIDTAGEPALAELLKRVSGVMRDGWVRLLYTHPARLTEELIDVIASYENICNYVDMPIQHASDDILRKMNRRVSRQEMADLIGRIRGEIEGVVLRTSVIVGFPGETPARFAELMDFLEEIKFDRLGAFTYSREEGTPAAAFSGHVPEKVKRRRFNDVMALQKRISADKNGELLGSALKVLIDEVDRSDRGLAVGRSEMDAPEVDGVVYVRGGPVSVGEFVNVKVTGVMEYDLEGEII